MKIYTTTKMVLLTLLLTSSGFIFAENHQPCPDGSGAVQRRDCEHGQFRQEGPRSQQVNGTRRKGMEAMNWLKEKDPKEFERLSALRQADRPSFFKEMHKVMKGFMKKNHPEIVKMHEQHKKSNQKIKKLADKYKKAATAEEKAKIETNLKQVLGKQFDSKQKLKFKEVKKLENRTNKLKESLETRLKNKESIIATRLKSITEGKEAVEW